jgi:hypothetical protein
MEVHMIAKFQKVLLVILIIVIAGCEDARQPSSDQRQQAEQERILQEGTSSVGMPNIKNFREKRMMKDILEMRDQMDYVTYTYLFSEFQACVVFVNEGIGYPVPYSTQYTNPQKVAQSGHQYGYAILPQADPNGLFSPSSSEATWSLLKNPNGRDAKPIYSEPKLIVSPFKLPKDLECPGRRSAYVDDNSTADKSSQEKEKQAPGSSQQRKRPQY